MIKPGDFAHGGSRRTSPETVRKGHAAGKRRMSRKPSKKRRGLHGPSFLGGIILGAGCAALAVLAPGFISEQFGDLPALTTGQEDLEVVFEFPELLRRSEVPVDPASYGDSGAPARASPLRPQPDDSASPVAASPVARTAGEPAPGQAAPVKVTRIYIQAASFRDADEADQLRARLLLQGLPVNLGQVVLDDVAWHRVTVGPIESAEKADQVMTRLREQNLSAMRINPG